MFEYLLTQEFCPAASFLPEVLHSQKQLKLSEVMDDSKSLWGVGPKKWNSIKQGGRLYLHCHSAYFTANARDFPNHLEN